MTNGLQVSTSGASATSLTYDLNGNLLSDGTNSYAWDAENRMIEITYPGSSNFSSFVYDGLGRNVSIVETTGGSVASTKQFVWCGHRRSEARSSIGALVAQFFVLGETVSGTIYLYAKDRLSSVRELTSSAGSVQAEYSYDPFGSR